MDFDLNDEQRMLRESLDRLLAQEYDFERRRAYLREASGWSAVFWNHFAEMGLLALPFAADDGGLGGGPVEQMLVMEALGRHLTLEPYLATVVLSGTVLRHGASSAQKAEWVPAIAEGSLTLALAYAERQSRYALQDVATTAREVAAGWQLDGSKVQVLHGGSADRLIVSARVDGARRDATGLALFVVDANAAGLTRRAYVAQDKLNMADIRLDGVRVPREALIGSVGDGLGLLARAVDNGIAAVCAEAVGAMERAHEITVDYLKVRKQFGVAIGSFQALQHRAVDMLVLVEQSRSMAMFAAMSADIEDAGERAVAMSAAKVLVMRSGRWVAQQGVQLHGGIGVTEECHVGHYLRRLSMMEPMFGDIDHHLHTLSRSPGLLAA
jgi:pimeloyl-CoA dehydrogenase small subunit